MVDVISTKRGVFVLLFAILYVVVYSLQLYLSYFIEYVYFGNT